MFRQPTSGFTRIPYVQVCQLEVHGAARRALLCNLSILGAYVHLQTPIDSGAEVSLSFRLPGDEQEIEASAVVTWANDTPAAGAMELPLGCGLRFVSVRPDDLRRIAATVAGYLESPHEEVQLGVGLPPSGKVRIPFISLCEFSGEFGEVQGSVCNLSTLGAYAALDRILDVGEPGRIRFAVPGLERRFECDATVTWYNPDHPRRLRALPPGCGLRFENLSPIDEMVLTTLVSDYLEALALRLPA